MALRICDEEIVVYRAVAATQWRWVKEWGEPLAWHKLLAHTRHCLPSGEVRYKVSWILFDRTASHAQSTAVIRGTVANYQATPCTRAKL